VDADLHLVLVTPEIPANTGNIMRLCAATGVRLHLIEPLGFTLDHKELRRAGMDYRAHCCLSSHLTFEALEQEHPAAGFHFLSARAERSFFSLAIATGDFLVLGPESRGLSPRFLSRGERRLHTARLPMPGRGRSLNLSTAAGVVVYESLRQLGCLAADPPAEPATRSAEGS
jgi:tRNA (cytidine/uridine-2'-O-)-methyltransferase